MRAFGEWCVIFASCHLVAHVGVGIHYGVLHGEICLVAGLPVCLHGYHVCLSSFYDERCHSLGQLAGVDGVAVACHAVIVVDTDVHDVVAVDVHLLLLVLLRHWRQIAVQTLCGV